MVELWDRLNDHVLLFMGLSLDYHDLSFVTEVNRVAKLRFYYSAMNAGKSTNLLQSSHNYNERGMDTVILTPAIDDRYNSGWVTSRIGLKSKAVVFHKSDDLYQKFCELYDFNENIKCVLVDEAQFLTKNQVHDLTRIVDEKDLPVLAYGIRTDFLGETFEGSQYLLAWADSLVELKTICHCGRAATMNLRINEDGKAVKQGEQVHIGGNESYVATCRKHFYMGQATKKVVQNDHADTGVLL